MKLTQERRWWLSHFPEYGWGNGRPNLNLMKKWQAHTAALVKMGLLERDPKYNQYRRTDAGRAALSEGRDNG